jgi:hypothetical protein
MHALHECPALLMQNNGFVSQESIFRDDLINSYDQNWIEKSFGVQSL